MELSEKVWWADKRCYYTANGGLCHRTMYKMPPAVNVRVQCLGSGCLWVGSLLYETNITERFGLPISPTIPTSDNDLV